MHTARNQARRWVRGFCYIQPNEEGQRESAAVGGGGQNRQLGGSAAGGNPAVCSSRGRTLTPNGRNVDHVLLQLERLFRIGKYRYICSGSGTVMGSLTTGNMGVGVCSPQAFRLIS